MPSNIREAFNVLERRVRIIEKSEDNFIREPFGINNFGRNILDIKAFFLSIY
jgi:hypothetical protein